MKQLYVVLFLSLFSFNASAIEIADITLKERISLNGKSLALNGAGIRYKFIFKIYVAGLYLEETSQNPKDILSRDATRSVQMHIVYDHIEQEKMADSIIDGLKNNLSKDEYAQFESQIIEFAALSRAVNEGDTITYDYIPKIGTRFSINGNLITTVPGLEFNNALMRIWLGNNPPSEDLKNQLLGID